MLTDIFAERYAARQIWAVVGDKEVALLTQCFRVVSEQLMPYLQANRIWEEHVPLWRAVERKLSMELGLEELSARTWNFMDSANQHQYGTYNIDLVCRSFMHSPFQAPADPDRHMKVRASLIELAFREKQQLLARNRDAAEQRIAEHESRLGQLRARSLRDLTAQPDVNYANQQRAACATAESHLLACAEEVNVRFRQADAPLNLHNGLIQVTGDALTEAQIAVPFWSLTADRRWANVDIDMKEAVDRREAGDRDPAFYAAKALESAIKIISDMRGWTRGSERNVNHYIDNLQARANGGFLAAWEAQAIRHIFAEVRNELGHGPGGGPMPQLAPYQTDWSIEAAMSWTKSLILRL